MLNELKIIADGLDKIGENVELIHRDIFLPGGTEALRVILSDDSLIESIEYMNAEQLANCWGLRTSYQDQFPCIKLTSPLRLAGNMLYSAFWSYESAKKNNLQKAVDCLKNQCELNDIKFDEFISFKQSELVSFLVKKYPSEEITNFDEWPKKSYRKSILSRFELLKTSDDNEVEIVTELYRRYSCFNNSGVDLLKNLSLLVEKELIENTLIPKRILLNILFGENMANKKGDIKDTSRSILLLDFKPSKFIDEFASVRHRKSQLSKFLINQSPSDFKSGSCYLTGKQGNIISDKFPEKNLGKGKSVSKIILFSKFDDKGKRATVQRYNRSGTDSYLLDIEESSRLGEVLVKLTEDKNKGKTWISIPSEGKKQDLLVTFCRFSNISMIPIITGNEVDSFDDYKGFTEDIINSFKGGDLPFDEFVDFVVFRKIDDGNQKVIYSITNSINRLENSAEQWQAACCNIPNLKLKVQIGKDRKLLSPWSIAPQKIIYISKQKFIHKGLSFVHVPAISFSDMMKLFLSSNTLCKQLAKRYLLKLSNQYEPLFSNCALSKLQSKLKDSQIKINYEYNKQALNAVTLIAILLYKIGRTKEIYMNGFAFQLGQLCSAIDELHIGYCAGMRGGKIPNTLIGNLTYGMALQSPERALEVLSSRIRPYQAWAKKELNKTKDQSSDDKAIRAGLYAHQWLKEQSKKINDLFAENISEVNGSYKAELMLGYLAGRPFIEKKQKSNNTQGVK